MATAAERFDKEKRKRTVLRMATTKLLNKIDREIQEEGTDSEALEVALGQLIEKEQALSKVDTEIEHSIEDLDALEVEIGAREEYREKVSEGKTRATRRLKKMAETESTRGTPAHPLPTPSTTTTTASVRLPRLSIDKFNGSACNWQSFWAQYNSAIHGNRGLDPVDKFSYLKAYLEGTAAAAIAGLPLSSDNYDKAIDILTKRFGRRETLISAHMNRLLTLTPIKGLHDLPALRRLYDDCEVQIRSLETMGMTAAAYGSLLCPLLFKLIPHDLTLDFNRRRNDQEDVQVDELLAFIRREIESRERTLVLTSREDNKHENLGTTHLKGPSTTNPVEANKRGTRFASAAALNTAVEEMCLFCNKTTHKTDECAALSIPEKKDTLRKGGRCYVCYKKRHLAKNCRANVECPICQKRHRKGLCWQAYPQGSNKGQALVTSVVPKIRNGVNAMETVLLQTVRAKAIGLKSNLNIRCLLDGGSQRTFVRADVSRKLRLPVVGEEELSLHTFGRKEPVSSKLRRVLVKLQQAKFKDNTITVEALEIPEICTSIIQIPSRELQTKLKDEGLHLSDEPSLGEANNRISMLIGADFYWKIVTGEVKRLTDSLVAVDTRLGWSVQGVTTTSNLMVNQPVGIMKVVVRDQESDEQLASEQLKRFWDLDSMGVVDNCGSQDQGNEVWQNFEATVRLHEGRYEVRLPWKGDNMGWPNNLEVAEKRLNSLVQKLKRNPSLFTAYEGILKDQLAQGIIEEVPTHNIHEDKALPIFYLPHQAVIKPENRTTNIRIVFDASAHVPNCPSLNDLLHSGPNLNPDLLNLLIRFRTNEIAIAADIEKAFLQIGLAEEDRDAVRFLWFDGKPDGPIKVKKLRMKRVLFGVTSSPFLLAAVLSHHIQNNEVQDPETCKGLKDSLYVDDWMSGAPNVDDAFKLSSKAKNIMEKASFTLRKWQSNSDQLKEKWRINEFDISDDAAVIGEPTIPTKVLGLLWDTRRDIFKFNVSNVLEFLLNRTKTKRCVLQAAGRIFDPIGFLSPFIVRVKILFQGLWECGLQWDQELPESIREQWDSWCLELADLHLVSVPRYCFSTGVNAEDHCKQLHCFTDASAKAYGAVLYLRYATGNGQFKSAFIASKSRVAPLKKMSIPRLELMGALIGARLVSHVKQVFPPEANFSYFFWTDSLITLCWIRSAAGCWKPFVSNRIQEIQSLSEPDKWRHCPGTENPADDLTRGRKVREIAEDKLWWGGPRWLIEEESCWPKVAQDKVPQDQEVQERKKDLSPTQVLLCSESPKNPLLDLTRFSRLVRVLRVTAWIYRFVHNAKMPLLKRSGPLDASETQAAEKFLVKETQRQSFEDELAALRVGKEIERTSKIANLSPSLDKEEMMRVGGRLQHANLTFEERHPLLIPNKNRFATLLIEDCHERVAHSGVGDTLAQIRGRMWIPRARQMTKTIIKDCRVCKKFNARPLTEKTAPLPQDRVQPSPPFEITGVDFAGPIYARNGTTSEKTYISLFTCAVTRAVHLELVSDMTTEKFILAFRRFISRRGICKIVYSDNAKTFKGTARRLKTMWNSIKEDELKEFYGTQGIIWKHIVERAPWWGGFWERLVRSVKTSLKKILGKSSLTFEELNTVLTQVEAVINSRPITYTSSDTEDPIPLTPSHFLIGKRLTALPEKMASTVRVPHTRRHLTKRYHYQQTLLDGFWKRWSQQYLMELRSAHLRTPIKETPEIKEGDVVLLYENRTPRLLWRMGLIETAYRGRDGKVRSCKLRLPGGIMLKRPIQLLYPIEVQQKDHGEEGDRADEQHVASGREDVVNFLSCPPPRTRNGGVPQIRALVGSPCPPTTHAPDTEKKSPEGLPPPTPPPYPFGRRPA